MSVHFYSVTHYILPIPFISFLYLPMSFNSTLFILHFSFPFPTSPKSNKPFLHFLCFHSSLIPHLPYPLNSQSKPTSPYIRVPHSSLPCHPSLFNSTTLYNPLLKRISYRALSFTSTTSSIPPLHINFNSCMPSLTPPDKHYTGQLNN